MLVVVVVVTVLIVLAGLRVLRRSGWRWVRGLRLWVGGALRWDNPRGREELVNGGTQVGHLGGVQRPVVELRLPHALLQAW